MGAGSSGAGSGVVVGVCLVLLAQQFGFLDLGALILAIIYLVAFAAVFAVVFGLLGVWLGARYLRKHAAALTEWKPTAAPATGPAPGTPDESEPKTK